MAAIDSAASSSEIEASDPFFINSLARALTVLTAIDPSRPEVSQKEIAQIAGTSVPSALRIGHTLVTLGFLTRNPATKGYRLGPQVTSLGVAMLSSMPIIDASEPHLLSLRDRFDETVKLAVRQDSEVVYVSRFASSGYQSRLVVVGTRLGVGHTSMGRAILSRLPRDDAYRILAEAARHATGRRAFDPDDVIAIVDDARDAGFAINDQKGVIEHRSLAAPVVDRTGWPVAAVNVSVYAQRIDVETLLAKFANPVVETARRISDAIADDDRIVGAP